MADSSSEEYGSASVVDDYSKRKELQKPEATILRECAQHIASSSMLDIGVGGGRTTVHFAPKAKQYIGVDYAPEMVEACRARFDGKYSFEDGDVREMSAFSDESFGFVLFSYNGLDYIEHADRITALKEIYRVQKSGGLFCFSTHNIQCVPGLFNLRDRFSFDARETIDQVLTWGRLRMRFTRGQIRRITNSDHEFFFDGYRDTYYIRPALQVRQLEEVGYTGVRIFSLNSGLEISSTTAASANDYWLYFLAEKR